MDSLPTTLIDSLPADLIGDAEEWWQGLADSERAELKLLCNSRKNLFLFETFSEAEIKPEVEGGKFIPGANAFGVDDWGEDYFQHLLDHPELIIVHDPVARTFHIGCSDHIDARRCFALGSVSGEFACPFGSDRCLMHQMLAGRSELRLRLRLHASQK